MPTLRPVIPSGALDCFDPRSPHDARASEVGGLSGTAPGGPWCMPTLRPVIPSGALDCFDPRSPTDGRALEHVSLGWRPVESPVGPILARKDRLHHR